MVAARKCEAKLELLAEVEHDRWSTERLLDGWIYRSERNNAKRHHPDIQPFANLSKDIKDIDVAKHDNSRRREGLAGSKK